MPNATEKLKEG